MQEIMKKKRFRLWTLCRNMIFIFVAAFIIWIIFNYAMTAYEQYKYPPIGEFIEIGEEKMHIYSKGEGEHTIVLLSGLGTAAPALDYEPLLNELAKKHQVVVVETFGYGWSDVTDKERTVKNIVEEIRYALMKSGIDGPYILMPHSVSGIYSMYYAHSYPEEVQAVIGIDPTFPQALEYFGESAPATPEYFRYVAPSGLARLALYIYPKGFLPVADDGTYSEENQKRTKAITAWKGYNKNIVMETNELSSNIEKTRDMTFPANMPILIFTTKEDKVTEDGKNNVTFYETQLTDNPASKIITFDGHHYLHWTHYMEMSKEVHTFISAFSDHE